MEERKKRKHTLSNMRTIMIRLHASRRIVSVNVKSVQMGANLLDGGEVLDCGGACLEDFALGGSWGTGGVGTVAGGHFILLTC